MKPLLLGIDGLSYSSFMKCNPRFIMTLFSTTFRGVVVNRKPQHPSSSWLSVLEMKEIKGTDFVKVEEMPKLIKETGAIAVNLPISNPTYGEVSFPYSDGVSIKEEIDKVVNAILENLDERPVIADITALDRLLHTSQTNKCELYKEIDEAVRRIIHQADDYILFSPYGEPKSEKMCDHEEYGVYIATIPRPNEHDVVRLPEIGVLFKRLVTQS